MSAIDTLTEVLLVNLVWIGGLLIFWAMFKGLSLWRRKRQHRRAMERMWRTWRTWS